MASQGRQSAKRVSVDHVQFEFQILILQLGMASFFCAGVVSGLFGSGNDWHGPALTWIVSFQLLHAWSVVRRRLGGRPGGTLEHLIPVTDVTCVTAAWLSLGDPGSPLWVVHLYALVGYSRRFEGRSYALLSGFIIANVAVGGAYLAATNTSQADGTHFVLTVVLTVFMAAFASAVGDAWRRAETRARTLAETDPLTGISNRRTFFELLEAMSTDPENEFAVLMLDLDNFKRVNDEQGHLRGDALLAQTAVLLSQNLRPGDHIARYGGEEFVVVLPGASLDEAERIGERLRSAVAEETPTSISVGCAARRWGESAEAVVRRADDLLLAAKRMGKNLVMTTAAA